MNKTIFVQIASYRDPELIPTLNNMIELAENKSGLNICVCWQHGDDETIELFLDNGYDVLGYSDTGEFDKIELEKDGASIELIDVHYHKTTGACWARNLIQQQYNNQDYTLQLDSHHRFVENWDTVCIEMLESLREDSEKPLLTAYIPSYNPKNDPKDRVNLPWKMNFDRFIPEGAVFFLPATIDEWEKLDKPIRSRFYSAHFCFTDGIFAKEVQHDPEYFFHGEEISIAVRAFTHGYDLYHPHRVIAWHEYTRENRTKVWDDHTSQEKKEGIIKDDWLDRNNKCHKRNRILFGMDGEDPNSIDFGKYGFGDVRTVRDYELYAGISFQYRGVQQRTLDKKPPLVNKVFDDLYKSEEEWENSFTQSNDIRVCIHKSELDSFEDDFDFFYVAAHDEDGHEMYRKDLTKDEIYNHYRNSEWIDYQFIFLADKLPKTYVVWPHSESKGWLNRIEKNAF